MLAQATKLQKRAVNSVINMFEDGEDAVLVQSMTGSGKTYIGMEFIKWYLAQDANHRAMIVVPTVALVEQFHETAQRFGFEVAIYHGTLKYRIDASGKYVAMRGIRDIPNARICITLPDTFATLVQGTNHHGWNDAWNPSLLLMDEAHKNTSENSQAVRNRFLGRVNRLFVLGLTATPRREQNGDGENLLEWYGDNLICAATPKELLEAGRIVAPIVHEFSASDVEVAEWRRLTQGESNKSTIIIAKDTAHAYSLVQAFNNSASVQLITSVGIEGRDDVNAQTVKERQKILADFRNGLFEVLVSVNTVCEGFDAPRARYVMICRDMAAEALYHQVVGRVMRVYEGKENGIVMDFGGNHKRYGSIMDKVWTVADYAPVHKFSEGKRSVSATRWNRAQRFMIVCACEKVYDAKKRETCPACRRETNIEITVENRDILEGCNISCEEYLAFQVPLKMAATSKHHVEGAPARVIGQRLNERTGIDLFLPEIGINPEYKIIGLIFANSEPLGMKRVFKLKEFPSYLKGKVNGKVAA